MKMNRGFALVLMLLVATLLVSTVFAQETTAGVQGTVKDPQGLAVSKAIVEVSGPALIGTKKAETDASGYFRFANLPVGEYTITVSAPNFKTSKLTGVKLATGALPTIDPKLEVGAVEQTVEVSGEAPIVDVATSKAQTNVTSDMLDNVPKGRSFQSVIAFAPGARNEPLQGGFQIDGASNTENSYLVEGQETASGFTGESKANVPIEFIQEVQVKSSGFEAEHGGALGGVVNVIQKRGGNAWHGSFFGDYQADMFDAVGANDNVWGATVGTSQQRQLRRNPALSPVGRIDAPTQFYQPKKDHYRYVRAGFEAGGFLVKDRVWLFSSFAPDMKNQERVVRTGPTNVVPNTDRSYEFTRNTYFAMNRVDAAVTSKIRVFGTWQYQYRRDSGNVWPNADDVNGLFNPVSSTAPDSFNRALGTVYPNSIYNTGADITLTPSLVSTTRYGYFYFDNGQTRGTPQGIRYFYRNTNYSYDTTNVPATSTQSLQGAAIPAAFAKPTGFFNFSDNTATVYDSWKRYSLNQDIAYFKKGFLGTHNLKFGYAFNRGVNNILSGFNSAAVYLAYAGPLVGGVPSQQALYTPQTSSGRAACAAIQATNLASYGTTGSPAGSLACQGLWGTVNFRELGTTGKVGGNNHAFYFQDAWTIGTRLTLNLGVRLDKEALPTYIEGFKGIDFGWGDKIAPRLGASYDLLGNGKMKVYGSFGYFYDIMKYSLPRGSFGGDYWHDCVYALDNPDYTLLVPTRGADSHYCPINGGATGTIPNARFIENVDFRQPANDPNSFGSLGATGLVDPKLKPMKQHEMVVGFDWALTPTLSFESRYSRKRLDRTIEDAGILTDQGEQFYITNPGEFFNAKLPSFECTTCPANPKPERRYDGLELRVTKRPTGGKWFGSVSYTYSALKGNYSGLTATDVSDGGGARNGANADRAFDEPFMQYDAHGKVIDGPLATDRPHAIKAMGYYRVKWGRMETLVGAFQQFYSGTPLSTYMSVLQAPVFLEGRGKWADISTDAAGNWVLNGVSERRTPHYVQTDLNFVQDFHVSKTNERLVLGFETNVTNLFNQRAATYITQNAIRTSYISPALWTSEGLPADTTPSGIDFKTLLQGYNYIGQANTEGVIKSSLYGLPYGWQLGRALRFKLKFAF